MGIKKVGVAALPGKTKHFQTLNLSKEITLCDCPGLVFPSFANSKSEMMCCGVLPIDQMRDHISPIQLVLSRLPKDVLEVIYKIVMPPRDSPKYTAATFLQVIASKRGWMTGRGLPNENKAAKAVMKDYTTGALLHCMLRPDFDIEKHGDIQQSGFNLDMSVLEILHASEHNYSQLNSEDMASLQTSAMISHTSTMFPDEENKLSAEKPKAAFDPDQAEKDLDN